LPAVASLLSQPSRVEKVYRHGGCLPPAGDRVWAAAPGDGASRRGRKRKRKHVPEGSDCGWARIYSTKMSTRGHPYHRAAACVCGRRSQHPRVQATRPASRHAILFLPTLTLIPFFQGLAMSSARPCRWAAGWSRLRPMACGVCGWVGGCGCGWTL